MIHHRFAHIRTGSYLDCAIRAAESLPDWWHHLQPTTHQAFGALALAALFWLSWRILK